jgi:hypothetical protein
VTQQRRVFDEEGKPLGMFPENQAKTMCVDVDSVYSPPIADSNFNDLIENRSQSGDNDDDDDDASSNGDETSSICSSVSSSSVSMNIEQSKASAMQEPPCDDDNLFEESAHCQLEATQIIEQPSTTTTPQRNSSGSQTSAHTPTTNPQAKSKKTSLSRISKIGDDLGSKISKQISNILNDSEITFIKSPKSSVSSSNTDFNNNNNTATTNKFTYEQSQPLKVGILLDQTNLERLNVKGTDAPQSPDLNTENQHFLKEVLISVLEGQGVGWLKYNRVKRLMEDENYRNFILSRLNTSLDKKLLNDEEHIEDVKVVKAVFKGVF